MLNNLWNAEIDGTMSSETDGFRLEVKNVGGMARFLILRQAEPGTRLREILASGSQMNERSAMTAAQHKVEQLRRVLTMNAFINVE